MKHKIGRQIYNSLCLFVSSYCSSERSERKHTNLARHLGAIAQWISRLHAWVRPIITAMPCGLGSEVHSAFLRAVELQSSDLCRIPSATERMLGYSHGRKTHNIRFFELWQIWVVADFPLDFPVVFTISIIMNWLRYIIESCQSFQTVLFSGLRNISL